MVQNSNQSNCNDYGVLTFLLKYSTEDVTGDRSDLVRICRSAMNKASCKRLISKQEAMVLLAELPLTACTESIETVSISRSNRLRKSEDKSTDKTFVTRYMKRPQEFDKTNMADYYHYYKNTKKNDKKYYIPNFVGVNGTPRFPVTESYARHTLIVYRPWRDYPTLETWKREFNTFINSKDCPIAAKLPYERVLRRSIDKMLHYEPKAADGNHTDNVISENDRMLLELTGLKSHEVDNTDDEANLIRAMDLGLEHEWDKTPMVSENSVHKKNGYHQNCANK